MKRNNLTIALVVGLGFGCWLVKTSADDGTKAASQIKTDTTVLSDTTGAVTPSVTYAGVSGNKSAFREATGIKDGWSGGIEEFKLSSKVNKDTDLNIEGRGLFDDHDY